MVFLLNACQNHWVFAVVLSTLYATSLSIHALRRSRLQASAWKDVSIRHDVLFIHVDEAIIEIVPLVNTNA